MTTTHPIRWQAPQPLWARFGSAGASAAAAPEQAQPALLRFDNDDFMDQMLATLARDPAQIAALIARPETWRQPAGATLDLMERTPLPRLAKTALRQSAALQPKARVAPAVTTPEQPLKLYQAAHQRHYLVSASLVCAQHGLPERGVVPGGSEQVHAVLRRLLPDPGQPNDKTLHEWAYVQDADGPRWQRVAASADAGRPVADEERLPLFGLAFQDDLGHARRLWTGLVPVGRREDYMGTRLDRSAAAPFAQGQQGGLQARSAAAPATGKLARTTQFQLEVAEPWKTQIRSAFKLGDVLREPTDPPDSESPAKKFQRVFDFNMQQQNVSWLILLDLSDFLETHLPALWQAVTEVGGNGAALSGFARDVFDFLVAAKMGQGLIDGLKRPVSGSTVRPPANNLREALMAIRQPGVRQRLEATTLNYDASSTADPGWPGFHFVLAGLSATDQTARGPFEALNILAAADADSPVADPLAGPVIPVANRSDEEKRQEAARLAAAQVDQLTSRVVRALDSSGDAAAPPLPFALQLKNSLAGASNDPGWFLIRFVYARVDCGPLHPPLLSAPSAAFQLANFFDSDAPARPIRITLPVDTSPAGLRKFNKSTAFVVSDMLCGQIQRAKGLGLVDLVRSVLPWPLHKDLDVPSGSCQTDQGLNLGMICSLSIPIITICALLLLIIIVTLLDFIFRWLPYFAICFPVPGLKGKKP